MNPVRSDHRDIFMIRFLSILLLAAMVGTATFAVAEAEQERQVRADCQAEGEAGGLAGTDLEDFVDSCVSELLEVELINVAN
jgi:hypothetical protein